LPDFRKFLNIIFYEYPSNGSRGFFHTDGHTDCHEEADSRISKFCDESQAIHAWKQQTRRERKLKVIHTYKSYRSTVHFCRITSVYQPTNSHIISHKTLLKYFETLRHVSILSDHHQGALFLAKVMLQYAQLNSYLQTRICGGISCCVGMCCGAVASGASYEAHRATDPQHIPTQHDKLPQHLICKYELNCEYCNITLARNKAP
jgi:hypothetical protein